jgi:hypothetical protein
MDPSRNAGRAGGPVRLPAWALAAIAVVAIAGANAPRATPSGPGFAGLIAQLSEKDGYFDTDNLISNEKSYLHVIPSLRQSGLARGVYIGVGPDQNFSYIAQLRPVTAFIVDVRRDNLLLHILFKALFGLAPTRLEYLALLTGRPVPDAPADWRTAPIEKLVAYVDGHEAVPSLDVLRARVDKAARDTGVPLSASDLATIHRFHRTFINAGLSLKFQTTGRSPRSYYPTYRELLLETDRDGHHWNYLASEDDYQFVRSLEARDLVIPVVGDLGGTHALAAIGRLMAERGERLTAFYTSNVEFYLARDGSLPRFMENLKRLPHTDRSLIIRAVFPRGMGYSDPVAGYYSRSEVQPVAEIIKESLPEKAGVR